MAGSGPPIPLRSLSLGRARSARGAGSHPGGRDAKTVACHPAYHAPRPRAPTPRIRPLAPAPEPTAPRSRPALLDLRAGEGGLLLLSAAYFFCVLAAWYVLRPIRDAMGVAGGVDNLAWLFLGTLSVTLLAQPPFAALASRLPRTRFVPWVYRFFALNLVLFYFAIVALPADRQVWVGRVFFVWTTVFSLFVVSVFWSFMADLFRPDQGKRLFGAIAAGGTLGGLVGGAVTAGLAERLGTAPLLLVSVVLLEAAVQCVRALGRRAGEVIPGQATAAREPLGGSLWAGITHVAKSPYLAGICLFLLLYTIGSTFLYFLQAQIAADAFATRVERAAFFARIDVWVNALTLLLQTGVTARVLSRLGVGGTLVLVPLLSLAGYGALALAPTLAVLVAFQVARRAGNFALMRPARENLFIPLAREDKYKAKSVIDTFVYRFGDQVGAWTHTGLAALGLGIAGIATFALSLAAVWSGLALWLGRRHAALVRTAPNPNDSPPAPSGAGGHPTPGGSS